MKAKALRQKDGVKKSFRSSSRNKKAVVPPAPSVATAPPTAPSSSTNPPSASHALDVMLSQELKGVIKRERDQLRKSFDADSKVIADEVESRIRDIVIEKATSAAVAAAKAATTKTTAMASKATHRGKKRATVAVSPKLGLSRAERIKARKLKEKANQARRPKVKSAGTQSTPSLSRDLRARQTNKHRCRASPCLWGRRPRQ